MFRTRFDEVCSVNITIVHTLLQICGLLYVHMYIFLTVSKAKA